MSKILVFLVVILLAVGVSIMVPEVRRAIVQLVVGRLMIGGANPEIIAVFIENVECNDPFVPGTCQVIPNDGITNGGVKTIRLNATVYDINGDCDGSLTFYICTNETGSGSSPYCNAALIDNNPAGIGSISGTLYAQYPAEGYYCNYTATYDLHYFKRWGNWYVNVTASDTQGLSNSTTKYWIAARQISVTYIYPTGDSVDLGAVSLDAAVFDEGRGQNKTRNTGNVRLNLTWNASDFVCGACAPPPPPNTIEIDGVNFAIGNETTRIVGTYAYIPDNPYQKVSFFPTGGMRRCGNLGCTVDEDGGPNYADYYLYWHINVTSPKQPGTYTNTIEISRDSCEGPGASPC